MTHSLQMLMPSGPAITFSTASVDLPQNEQCTSAMPGMVAAPAAAHGRKRAAESPEGSVASDGDVKPA